MLLAVLLAGPAAGAPAVTRPAAAPATTPSPAPTAAPDQPAGHYSGVMVCQQASLRVQLQLSPGADGLLQVQIQATRLSNADGRLQELPPLTLQGRVDPVTSAFTLPAGGGEAWPQAWSGVVLPGGAGLLAAGGRGPCSPWVAWRGEQPPALWALLKGGDAGDRLHSVQATAAAVQALHGVDEQDRVGTRCPAPIPAWLQAAPPLQAPPGSRPGNEALRHQALVLLREPGFSQHFGKPYEAFTLQERAQLAMRAQGPCSRDPALRAMAPLLAQVYRHTNPHVGPLPQLPAMQAAAQWLPAQLQRLQALPATPDAVSRIDAIAAAAAPVLPLLAEAEALAFRATVQALRLPLLADWLQGQLEADAASELAHERLPGFERRHAADLAALQPAQAQALRARLAQLGAVADAAARQASDERLAQERALTPAPASSVYTGAGAPYLIALVNEDLAALAAMDAAFARPYSEGFDQMVGSGMLGLLGQLVPGAGPDPATAQRMCRAVAAMSIAMPLAGAYIASYEHLFAPECMDEEPVLFVKTVHHRGTVWRNLMGVEISRTPAWTSREHFRVNRRFEPVFRSVSDSFRSQNIDLFAARPGQMRLSDVVQSLQQAMRRYRCDSPEMKLLEQRLMARYEWMDARMRAIAQGR